MEGLPHFRLEREFYTRDVLDVAPGLLGKLIVLAGPDGNSLNFRITETEAYRGQEDRACHASKGRTARTEIMFHQGGHIYVYLIYGIYWMLNIVTSVDKIPQAVLIRGAEGYPGPGKLAVSMGINRSFYGIDLVSSDRIWIEDDGYRSEYVNTPRIGIDYAGSPWRDKPWRYVLKEKSNTPRPPSRVEK